MVFYLFIRCSAKANSSSLPSCATRLVMSDASAISERSFSALCHVRQKKLNNLIIFHIHNDRTDDLNLMEVTNNCVVDSEHRLGIFCTFPNEILLLLVFFVLGVLTTTVDRCSHSQFCQQGLI